VGTPFTLNSGNVTVAALGFCDQNSDGLASAHQVGIFGPD
jgi:hypothetical protein